MGIDMAMHIEVKKATEDLLQEIMAVDSYVYHIGLNWYVRRYVGKEFALLYDEDGVAGYAVAVPIAKPMYDALVSGVVVNDIDLNEEMFLSQSDYYYLASAVVIPMYRKKGWGNQLVDTALNHIKGQCVALVVSEAGEKLAKRHLTKVKDLPLGRAIYAGEINEPD